VLTPFRPICCNYKKQCEYTHIIIFKLFHKCKYLRIDLYLEMYKVRLICKKNIELIPAKETLGKFHHWFENHEFLNFAEESSNVKPYLSNPDKTSMWAHNCFWILNRQSLNCKLKYIFDHHRVAV